MRFKYFTFILIILTSCNGAGKHKSKSNISDNDSVSIAIAQLLNDQSKAWNNGDVEGFMKGYYNSDELKFITKRGVISGYDSISARYKRAYPTKEKMGHLEFNNLVYTRLANDPELFQVTGNWVISGRDSANGNFSLLVRKFEKDWRIIVDHTW